MSRRWWVERGGRRLWKGEVKAQGWGLGLVWGLWSWGAGGVSGIGGVAGECVDIRRRTGGGGGLLDGR